MELRNQEGGLCTSGGTPTSERTPRKDAWRSLPDLQRPRGLGTVPSVPTCLQPARPVASTATQLRARCLPSLSVARSLPGLPCSFLLVMTWL